MKNILKTLLMVLAILMHISCTSTATQSPSHSTTQSLDKSQVWQLVKIQGRNIDRTATPTTLAFNPEAHTLRGQTQCNTYSADYTLSQPLSHSATQSLTISNFQLSNVQCPDAEMNAETRYLSTLKKCTQLSLTATTLTLGNKNKALLEFELR